jgi:hypothetical protein
VAVIPTYPCRSSDGDSVTDRFILAGSPVLLRALVEVITQDPETEVVAISGPATAPERIVANMPPERADLLRRALGSQLTIEPDEFLQPFA